MRARSNGATKPRLSERRGRSSCGKAENGSENPVGGDGGEKKCAGDGDSEDSRIGREEHPSFKGEGQYDAPNPGAAIGRAEHRYIHGAESGPVSEVVTPAQGLGGDGIVRLLDGLPQEHRSETREYFEEREGRNHLAQAPFARIDERQPENVIGHRREQTAAQAQHHVLKQPPIPAREVEGSEEQKHNRGGQERIEGEIAHGADAIELQQKAGDGTAGEQENEGAPPPIPEVEAVRAKVCAGFCFAWHSLPVLVLKAAEDCRSQGMDTAVAVLL